MSRLLTIALALTVVSCAAADAPARQGEEAQAQRQEAEEVVLETDEAKLNYLIGHSFGEYLKELPVELDLDSLLAGLEHGRKGVESVLSEEEALELRQGFAQRAQAEGLVVMDDPISILRCTNKVFLAELLQRLKISQPKTLIVHRRNVDSVVDELRLPCVLKAPDSAFSRGVHKVESKEALVALVRGLLERSELIVAQEYLPTQYDWRVGMVDGKALYACRYWMANAHWQIVRHDASGNKDEGNADTLAIEDAPAEVIRMALKAGNAIGRGLYGVDIKEAEGRYYVIEVNDNPSIDGGVEDGVLKDDLYLEIMQTFLKRVEASKRGDA